MQLGASRNEPDGDRRKPIQAMVHIFHHQVDIPRPVDIQGIPTVYELSH